MIIGAQFYTIREYCKDLDGLAESLKKVADIGYTTVQLSGTCPYDPTWMKEQLDKNGLKCVITHNSSDALSNEPERLVKDHDILDCKYIGLGGHKIKDEDGMRYDDFFTKYLNTAKHFSKKNLMYILKLIPELDLSIKRGEIEQWQAAEKLIFECLSRRN